MEYAAALNVVGGLIRIAVPQSGTALDTIQSLIGLATSSAATVDDAKKAWELISGHANGETEIDEIEAEIEAMEARGLKPIVLPED